MEPPPLAEHLAAADAVFVGTVQRLRDGNRTATFSVEEQWSGPSLPAVVDVFGGPDDAFSATSVDRSYEAGVRYLVAVFASDGRLIDNSCSATRPWSDDLAALRPSDARTVTADDAANPVGAPTELLIALSVAAILMLIGALAFRRGTGTA